MRLEREQGAGASSPPFLTIITRCYKRPQMLANNRASLARQSEPDYEQVRLIDDIGIGVEQAQVSIADNAPHFTGQYAWILDDDDMCIHDTLIADLKAIAAEHDPGVVMVRMNHGYAVYPDALRWGEAPQQGRIGCSAYIVRRDIFQQHVDAFRGARYESDFDFINAVWKSNPAVYWHDVIASQVQRVSLGAPE